MATTSTRRRRRKAFIKFIIIVVILIIIFLIFKGCGNSKKQEKQDSVEKLNEEISTLEDRKDELTTQLEELESELASTEAELSNTEQTEEAEGNHQLISAMFWGDGNFYEDTNETKFYTDPNCVNKLEKKIRFNSPQIYEIELENGQTVYAMLSESGIVYSVYEPDLDIYVDPSEKG